MSSGSGAASRPLILVEPLACNPGGHWTQSLVLLARAATEAGRRCVVVAVNGIDPDLGLELDRAGATLVERPRGMDRRAAWLLRAADALASGYKTLQPRFPRRPLSYQLQHLSRCLIEAASLRLGRAAAGGASVTAVILTAGETLHASTVALAGVPHIRYVHEVSAYECRSIRIAERLLGRFLRRLLALCPTKSLQVALRERHPRLPSRVQMFALTDPGTYEAAGERAALRAGLGLPPGAIVGSLVGGWWRAKDPSTVVEALARADGRFTLLVAGHRMDPVVLAAMRSAHGGEMQVIDRQLTTDELRAVYGASDFTIVSRHPNGKESGVALDAVSHGVAVVVSDHEATLTSQLEGRAWARVFRCGDAGSLAQALTEATREPLPRPPQTAARELGMLDASQMLDLFDRVAPDGPAARQRDSPPAGSAE